MRCQASADGGCRHIYARRPNAGRELEARVKLGARDPITARNGLGPPLRFDEKALSVALGSLERPRATQTAAIQRCLTVARALEHALKSEPSARKTREGKPGEL